MCLTRLGYCVASCSPVPGREGATQGQAGTWQLTHIMRYLPVAAQPACCACSSLSSVSTRASPQLQLQSCLPAAGRWHESRHSCCLQVLLHAVQQRQQLYSPPRRYFSTQPGGLDKWGGGAAPWQQGRQGPLPGGLLLWACGGTAAWAVEQRPGSTLNKALYQVCWSACSSSPCMVLTWHCRLWESGHRWVC